MRFTQPKKFGIRTDPEGLNLEVEMQKIHAYKICQYGKRVNETIWFRMKILDISEAQNIIFRVGISLHDFTTREDR